MVDFIKWCNDNQGFLSAILSLGTLFVSVLAIIISVCTSRLPYKKKLLLTTGSYIGVGMDSMGIHVTATNIGNRSLKIKNIGLLINKQIYTNFRTIADSKIILAIGECTSQYFESNDLRKIKKLNGNFKVYGYVEDTENRKYKKYICRLKKIIW